MLCVDTDTRTDRGAGGLHFAALAHFAAQQDVPRRLRHLDPVGVTVLNRWLRHIIISSITRAKTTRAKIGRKTPKLLNFNLNRGEFWRIVREKHALGKVFWGSPFPTTRGLARPERKRERTRLACCRSPLSDDFKQLTIKHRWVKRSELGRRCSAGRQTRHAGGVRSPLNSTSTAQGARILSKSGCFK